MSAGQPYQVRYSGQIRELVRELHARARSIGVGARLARALREIEGHLELNPTNWGDPLKHLAHMRITIYRRLHDGLSVEYGVHDTEPYVWLSRIEPVLGHPLCETENDG